MVVINIKTLKRQKFTIEIDGKSTILELKKKIVETQKIGPVEDLNLIMKGKILPDSRDIDGLNIKGFLVLYKKPQKKKKVEAASSSTPTATPAPVPAPAPAPAPAANTQSSGNTPAPASSTSVSTETKAPTRAPTSSEDAKASGVVSSASSGLVLGEQYNETVASLMGMTGRTNEEVVMALRASFNNPNRAAGLLLEGKSLQELSAMASQMGGGGSSGSSGSGGGGAPQPSSGGTPQPSGGSGPPQNVQAMLQNLQNSPQAAQLRQLFQSNPQAAAGFLQNLAQTNPQLMQLINQNREGFLQAIMGSGGGGGGGGGGAPPGTMTITLTQEEKAGLDNLVMMLPYSRDQIIRAFIQCDRNLELTANYLMTYETPSGMEGVESTGQSNEEEKDDSNKPMDQQ
eukprot:CAMPEP_0114519112 /NCGR_PEP_ID=MMETSP0109-20121206/18821_1 /TAXON_ID=29199 /ORGANISM="Chlorarachnion reptans, Strain CCCM449" /LENGTH=399 /DNA_ID=CAMNT_0001699813 /DNA_START=74 /DNA_END=1273 /DNA_ORIENTATION=-